MSGRSDGLTFHEPFSPVPRALVGVAGLLTILAPWELLIHPGITSVDLATLHLWLIALGALLIGAPLLLAAALGLDRTVTLDPAAGTIAERARGSLGIGWTRSRSLACVEAIGLGKENWSDGPATWTVEARFHDGGKPWQLTRRTCREEALTVAREIADRSRLALAL